MCGRFTQGFSETHYAMTLDSGWTPAPLHLKPTWNVAPSRQALVLHDDDSGHVAELLHWGFLPSWADPAAAKPINARVETAATKPYFRHAWKAGRCLIPADGWYEWKATAGGKQPYFIHRADDEPLFMAGLYETNPQVKVTSFAILTTEAKGDLREIHDREPLVLSPEAATEWIRPDLPAADVAAISQLAPPSGNFSWHAVSARVNNTKNDGAELMLKT